MGQSMVIIAMSVFALAGAGLIILNPVWLPVLFPFFYIFYKVTPGVSTFDMLLVLVGIFALFCRRITTGAAFSQTPEYERKLLFVLAVYIFASIISLFNSPYSGPLGTYHVIATLVLRFLIIYVIVNIVQTKKDLLNCLNAMSVFLILTIISYFYFSIKYNSLFFYRNYIFVTSIDGTLLDDIILTQPNMISRVLILIIPIVYTYALYLKDKWLSMGLKGLCYIGVGIPFFGLGRATMVGVMFAIGGILLKRKKFVFIILMLAALPLFFSVEQAQERLDSALQHGYAEGARDRTAQACLESFKKYPWFGTGARSVIYAMEKFGGPTIKREGKTIYKYEHNQYLTLLAEGGVVGLVIFLGLTLLYLIYLYRAISNTRASFYKSLLFAALVAFLGYSLTTFTGGSTMDNIVFYFVGITLAIMRISGESSTVALYQPTRVLAPSR
jgi:O-antigen ligase